MFILSTLYHSGWSILTSTNIWKSLEDQDTLVFRFGPIPSPTSFFAVAFYESDKLRLIGAPEATINIVRQTIGPDQVQREEWFDEARTYQFKM